MAKITPKGSASYSLKGNSWEIHLNKKSSKIILKDKIPWDDTFFYFPIIGSKISHKYKSNNPMFMEFSPSSLPSVLVHG